MRPPINQRATGVYHHECMDAPGASAYQPSRYGRLRHECRDAPRCIRLSTIKDRTTGGTGNFILFLLPFFAHADAPWSVPTHMSYLLLVVVPRESRDAPWCIRLSTGVLRADALGHMDCGGSHFFICNPAFQRGERGDISQSWRSHVLGGSATREAHVSAMAWVCPAIPGV